MVSEIEHVLEVGNRNGSSGFQRSLFALQPGIGVPEPGVLGAKGRQLEVRPRRGPRLLVWVNAIFNKHWIG